MASRRRPHRVYDVGSEPDPRFTFANERTFLAWIRTALAMLAAGVALEAFVTGHPLVRRLVAAVLLAVGITCAVGALVRWARMERALRTGTDLPAPTLAPLLSAGVAVVGVLALALTFR